MRINNNLMAMNTHRQLGSAQANGAKSMEKLSSGFRINRAGDDAAGLSISEKMRGQIRGLDQASRNAQDGISLIQTAEGALNETHSILQRMRELSVQSSNDTNVQEDRDALQAEMDQLATEITRIADNTEFNTKNLLGGEFEGKFHIGANEGQNMELKIAAMDADSLKVQGEVYEAQDLDNVDNVQIQSRTGEDVTVEFAAIQVADGAAVTSTTAAWNTDGDVLTVTLAQAAPTSTGSTGLVQASDQDIMNAINAAGGEYGLSAIANGTVSGTAITNGSAGIADVDLNNWELDVEASAASGIDISSQAKADEAITTINTALERVSKERSMLGAVQNRLEHTISNLDNVSENLQASESRVRDVDMAKEMMELTKQNILQQASTAMLAQANQAPQSVLQLLG
ncbi:flagellin domain protein [Alkaliphilus metalliredigens QYMF]|uniref:Flagellin n=1 Tax=Alkaliphilus metalliredigens (strain QYMF) TaxID=293826 RepID=A6TL89_ALKMQ|nr:flagellin [Alkaliphilus metalliredigens]ABR46957.1 flagellin domain protein [Alkaliphilus metalliredigens QYMF]